MPHKDVEFHARRNETDENQIFHTWPEARSFMIGFTGIVDVLIHSEKGAFEYNGLSAVDDYLEDPHCSVFERWQRNTPNGLFNFLGKIP